MSEKIESLTELKNEAANYRKDREEFSQKEKDYIEILQDVERIYTTAKDKEKADKIVRDRWVPLAR